MLIGRREPEDSARDSTSDAEPGSPPPAAAAAAAPEAAQQLALPSAYLGRGLRVLLSLSDVALRTEPLATQLQVEAPPMEL